MGACVPKMKGLEVSYMTLEGMSGHDRRVTQGRGCHVSFFVEPSLLVNVRLGDRVGEGIPDHTSTGVSRRKGIARCRALIGYPNKMALGPVSRGID